MRFSQAFARCVFWRRDRDYAAILDPSLGNDVIGAVLHVLDRPAERRQFHAVVVIEMDVQRGQ
jgi:hypothetical protein